MNLSTQNAKTFATAKKFGRAAFVSALMGMGVFFAMPAQASDRHHQSQNNNGTIQFGFSFNSGTGNFSFGNGGFNGRQFEQSRRHKRQACLNEWQLEDALNRQGFQRVQFNYWQGPYVNVVAKRKGRFYAMDVNRCTSQISNLQRVSTRR